MRRAIHQNDPESFNKAMDYAVKNGMTLKKMRTSIRYLDPVERLKDEDEVAFLKTLTHTQQLKYKVAREHAQNIANTYYLWWWRHAKEAQSGTDFRKAWRKEFKRLRKGRRRKKYDTPEAKQRSRGRISRQKESLRKVK